LSFLTPWVLWGLVATGIPVVIHFFFRSRFRTVEWAAMEFLRQSIEQTNRRLRFQELLLLILRCLMVALVALALARPVWRGVVGGGGDAVDVVLVIDTSLSMAARDGGPTRLDRAKAAARAVLEHLPAHSTAQVITFSDRATLLGPRQPADLDQARQAIDNIVATARGSDLAAGLNLAQTAVRRGSSPQREVYILTDAQGLAFDRQASVVSEAAKKIAEVATVYVGRCGKEVTRNATLIGLAPQTGLPHTGERVGFAALIRNTGREPLRDLSVSLTADGGRQETVPLARLEPGETRAVTLTARWTEPGWRTVTARVRSDEQPGDDRFDRVLRVRDKVRVLVIDGAANPREPERSASYFLLHALAPVKEADRAGYYLQPRLVTPGQATPSLLADSDLCILVNVAVEREAGKPGEVLPGDFAEALYRYVRDGKSLVVFAGDRVNPAAYARAFVDRLPMLPLRPTGLKNFPERAEPGIDRGGFTDPAFAKFRDDETYQTFAQVKTQKLITGESLPAVEGRSPTRVLMRATDGNALIASRGVGAGAVAFVTTSADASWTDLPIWVNANVPIIDALLAHLLLAETDSHNAEAGAGLRWFAPAGDAERPFVLIRPDGERVRLGKPEPIQGRPRVVAADTPLAGIYRIAPADATETRAPPFAVVYDREEAMTPEILTDSAIDERLGSKPIHVTVTDDLSPFAGGERAKREWTPKLLWALLALGIAETLLAWYVGQPK
jgi:hypothetical protein